MSTIILKKVKEYNRVKILKIYLFNHLKWFIIIYRECSNLQGEVQFLTGGTARERRDELLIWCDSRADSIVWMREDVFFLYNIDGKP